MATAAHQQFSLKWNNYSQHIVTALEELRVDDELTDVTLSCDGQRIKAHKLLLSACSVFFKETFKENPCKHPVVILKGVSFQDLQAVVHFMYNGQVNVTQERLPSFLQTAEILHIKGLTENANEREETSIATPAPVKKRAQTFPNQASSDSGRLDGDPNRPPTPKRKKVIGSTGGAFASSQAQNSELPGTASVISTSGAAAGSAGAGNGNASQLKNNTQSSHPPALLAHNSDNSTDGLALVKYEEGDVDEEYDRTEENDHSFQDNGKDNGDSNSLAAIWARTSGLLGGIRAGAYDDQDDIDLGDVPSYQAMMMLMNNSGSGLDSGGEENNSQGTPSQGYVCSICGHVSRSAGGRSNHMQTHRDPKICPICNQTFLRRDNLNRHIREKHQGQRRRP